MQNNVEKILARGDKLDDILLRSGDLENTVSFLFDDNKEVEKIQPTSHAKY